MKTFGVDVSHWESKIDWQQAAPALGFAYYKCTEGTRWFDIQFDHNRKGCDQAGLPHAPYHYFHPLIDPVKQADFFISIAGKSYKRYILDVEKPDTVVDITPRIRLFLKRCEELTGIKPAIYTAAGYWNEFVNPKPAWSTQYDLIVANYTIQRIPIIPIGWTTYKIWQFSSYFFIPGCSEACDGNWFNGTLDQCRQWFGNYKPPEPNPPVVGLNVRSQFEGLYIRQGPSCGTKDIGDLHKDEVVQVDELGGKEVWIKHTRGWSCVEKDSYRYMEVVK
ncbi:MAG: hypothetical protein A2Z71_03355 [Chloroflexi bacterium RBG_13_50_21]|nr:MAG: hypothetical protein A2Z71_03355 [Chloroflexi bacterium RBG_13_50_21]